MSEMRMQEVMLVGRLVGDPIPSGENAYFLIQADEQQAPFQCIATGRTAENLLKFKRDGDEAVIQGKLTWKKFSNEKRPVLLIWSRYISYGRQARTLR
jgi:single-stranded DNA-binding protein